jgi:hypothetical protein
MAANNSINISSAGLVNYDGSSTFSGVTLTQHSVLAGGASNSITSIANGTTGQVLTATTSSDPSWQTPSNLILSTGPITWTNAALKAGTSLLILAAQGNGVVIIPVSVVIKLVYGGSNAFTNAPTYTLNYGSVNGTALALTIVGSVAFSEATANFYHMEAQISATNSALACENLAVYATLNAAMTGNAAGNNTIKVNMLYYLLSI